MPSDRSRILLTGALGTVGRHVLANLVEQGYHVTCLDVHTGTNRKTVQTLLRSFKFEVVWGDLRDAQSVRLAVQQVAPEAIVHMAAIVPPTAYLNPRAAYDVNVNGTGHLLAAANSLDRVPRLIHTSSYSVHGPRNPHKELPLLTGDTAVDPGDNYARHKVAGEEMVRESGLPWTILRLSAVMPLGGNQMQQSGAMKYLFLLPAERRQQGIDARDAGLAVANAVGAGVEGRTLAIGGGDDWRWLAGEFFNEMFEIVGIGRLPAALFRRPDPAVDASWYYEDWVDATESESLLHYQRHSRADYLGALRGQMGSQRMVVRLLAPLIRRQLLAQSPYYGQSNSLDPRTHWEVVCDAYGLDLSTR